MATTSSTLWNAVVLRAGKGAQDMLASSSYSASLYLMLCPTSAWSTTAAAAPP